MPEERSRNGLPPGPGSPGLGSFTFVISNNDFERARNRTPLTDCKKAYPVLLENTSNLNSERSIFEPVILNHVPDLIRDIFRISYYLRLFRENTPFARIFII